MVIRPVRRRCGQEAMTWRATEMRVSCVLVRVGEPGEMSDKESGGRPDLASSPEVLTWRRTLRGACGGRALLRRVASLVEERV